MLKYIMVSEMNSNHKKKVVIGLSGGVDSSVAALLLKQDGYEVIGVSMCLYHKANDTSLVDAKKVADKLDIPFFTIDFSKDFKKYVIDYFANEYINGRTPNPCIECNKHLKFGLMLKYAKEILNADYIATGHYAKIEYNRNTNRYYVKEAATIAKDQTYVLYSLTQEQLKHVLMPLGNYTKDEVRDIAKKNGFITAEKKDSQEICFVEDNDYAGFIKNHYGYKSKLGEFIDTKGNKYGTHKGIIHYTTGQRRGLGLSLKSPLYVKEVNPRTNAVILCSKEELFKDNLICNNINLMSIDKLIQPMSVTVKIRYSAPKAQATLIPMDNDSIKVVFNEYQRAITPGQAVVFYDGDIVVGGGTII